MSAVPVWMLEFFANNAELFVGYAICVIFPLPWLNRFILDLWAKVLSRNPDAPTN